MKSRLACLLVLSVLPLALKAGDAPDFTRDIAPLLARHCISCHCPDDTNGELLLDTFANLAKGGESGKVITPGKSGESLLLKLIESPGKNIMPPGKRKKLDKKEIALIKKWIDAGAPAPTEDKPIVAKVEIPKIMPKGEPKNGIFAVAYSPMSKHVAVGRYGVVELRNADNLNVTRTLPGHAGNVNALAFSADGSKLASISGETGVGAQAFLWTVADGKFKKFEGHKDAGYSVAISPDGKLLATGSYDQTIKLWDIETGAEVKTLSGHNGAVFSLAFRPDGKILASASLDRTVKLWDVAKGTRTDTLNQPTKELYTLAWAPDGKRLAAGGVDNRIRVWQIGETALDGSNPLLYSVFAHDTAILKLAYSPDGKFILSSAEDSLVKVWSAEEVAPKLSFEKQPDWVTGLAYISDKRVVLGRMNGSAAIFDPSTGMAPKTDKPELSQLEWPGLQRGVATKIKVLGKNLNEAKHLKLHHAKLKGEIVQDPAPKPHELWISVTAAEDMGREKVEFSLAGEGGESNRLGLFVDDLAVVGETEQKQGVQLIETLPSSVWGQFKERGDIDRFQVDGKAGQTLMVDVNTTAVGFKTIVSVAMLDAHGQAVPSEEDFATGPEPIYAFKLPADGRYTLEVTDRALGAGMDHYYRLSLGYYQYASHFFPLSVKVGTELDVAVYGPNIPADTKVHVKGEKAGELQLPLDYKLVRNRRRPAVLVSELPEVLEQEPNNTAAQATPLSAPGSAAGRIAAADGGKQDFDYFKFDAKKGQLWIVETTAAQRGSPIDTKIEVLSAEGKPVPRILLRATRDSYINFRPLDSNETGVRVKNYEEMELNEFMYLNGEVTRIIRMPEGPDSTIVMYNNAGMRRCYFDTSPSAHANEETCYIIEPLPVGAKPSPNGLPVFTLNFVNDDDGDRELGSDSRLFFTAPADGTYVVRVADTRGFGGDRYVYRLVVREAKPDFSVKLNGADPTVNPGSGRSFSVVADRSDGYEGEIRVEIDGLPPGFSASTPLVIQAGHNEAKGTLFAKADAPKTDEKNWGTSKVTAKAMVNGQEVSRGANNFGKIQLGDEPKLYVALDPFTAAADPANADKLPEITIAPGTTIPVWLRAKRNGHDDIITFLVDNLPHGVIVDNIGLNGVLMEKGLSERQIFLTCAKWVPETDRLCYAISTTETRITASQNGRQTSRPVLIKVRKAAK